MKKCAILIMSMFVSFLVSLGCAEVQKETQSVFKLPAALRIVEDEAFSGIAGEVAILQEFVEYIGDGAFADISVLSDVYIPETTRYIADDAFTGTNTIIHGIDGSFADQWAREHGFRFVHDNIWIAIGQSYANGFVEKLRLAQSFMGTVVQTVLLISCLVMSLHKRNRKRTKDYPELYAIDLAFP